MNELICFSHLRWHFVWQRPQHLMARAARRARVWFVEEPLYGADRPRLDRRSTPEGVVVCVPVLPEGMAPAAEVHALRGLIENLAMAEGVQSPVAWIYTPMMQPLVEAVRPRVLVYDCMDELSAFRNAPADIVFREHALLARADLVFTGGRSLYEARLGCHPKVYLFPSSVDFAHFAAARTPQPEPPELGAVGRPRFGWVGVIDERMDLALLDAVVRRRPDWQWVLVGPVVKIDPATLPVAPNLHRVGPRDYTDLPRWLAHVDVGIMPFARNDATRFISPTKTPEYLAAGLPVVSTPVRDVVRGYGQRGLVEIAEDPDGFVAACERALATRDDPERKRHADAFLATMSWDATWTEMVRLVAGVASERVAGKVTVRSAE